MLSVLLGQLLDGAWPRLKMVQEGYTFERTELNRRTVRLFADDHSDQDIYSIPPGRDDGVVIGHQRQHIENDGSPIYSISESEPVGQILLIQVSAKAFGHFAGHGDGATTTN